MTAWEIGRMPATVATMETDVVARDTAEWERRALAALDPARLTADLARLVREPSVTGSEREVIELLAAMGREHGLEGEVVEHDLAAVRAAPGYPGEEATRAELLHADVTLRGADPRAERICLNGHLDVVHEGAEQWAQGPWSAAIVDGELHGRGAADMKAGVAAALHAMAAVRAAGIPLRGDVVLQAVPSEEDGGLGTFAALERDSDFAACLIPEPTGFELVCAQAGALTFSGTVTGKAAHAAVRLNGVSAIDRYMTIHAALHEHERAVNTNVTHPLMRLHPLPYPLLVGQLHAGRWSSQVPDALHFEGRLGVRVGEDVAVARRALQGAVDAAAGTGGAVELRWTGGQFASAETDANDPWARLVAGAAAAELGEAPAVGGATWGADMRLFCARGIPTVMLGTHGLELAHAVDERVKLSEVHQLARVMVRTLVAFGARAEG